MKDVICSFASGGREPYNKMLLRLIDSVKEHWHGDMLVYSPDHWLDEYKGVKINKGWPQPKGIASLTHSEMPYQFKTALIQEALEMGYERIIWLDSSMQLKKDLAPLFDNSKTGVITFHNLGHPVHKYLSDKALELLDMSDDFIHEKSQIWGGAFMIDLTKYFARTFFERLKTFSVNGSFNNSGSKRPEFLTHRHDQAVMSMILHGGLLINTHRFEYDFVHDMLPYGHILCPPHDRTGEYGNDPYLVCRGL